MGNRTVFLKIGSGKLDIHMQKNKVGLPTSQTKYPDIRANTVTLLDEITGVNLPDLRLGNGF